MSKELRFVLTDDEWGYEIHRNHYYHRIKGELIVPETYNGKPILGIKRFAFEGISEITKIILPPSITRIGNYAFNGCTGLENINIPYGVRDIEYATFKKCSSLKEIEIPLSVRRIGWGAFQSCISLNSLFIHDRVQSVDGFAFSFWREEQTLYVNKENSQKWDAEWCGDCNAKIVFR